LSLAAAAVVGFGAALVIRLAVGYLDSCTCHGLSAAPPA
jgi:hypothetical protein